MRRHIALLALLTLALALGTRSHGHEKKPEAKGVALRDVLWRDPGPPATLDLFHGPGGKEHAPDPEGEYTFVEEVTNRRKNGFSPKFDVVDAKGVRFRVKVGVEAQPEVAATRLLWAAGYVVDEDYYLPELKVAGLPSLRRGQKYVTGRGVVAKARLERKHIEKKGTWSWFENPFVGEKEFDGLRVMMALINNWDLKAQNNAIYEVDGERRYAVNDVGASFGKTGNELTRSEGKLLDYLRSEFVAKVGPETVDLVMNSRPSILVAPDIPYYRSRVKMEQITRQIPRAHARWIGERLSELSAGQIADCFRAAGYSPAEVEGYTGAVRKRIAELRAL